jgi:glucose dehydrogenase
MLANRFDRRNRGSAEALIMQISIRAVFVLAVLGALLWRTQANERSVVAAVASAPANVVTDWPVYDGQAAGDHYSALAQINRSNVHLLKVAWTFDTHEQGGLETNPLVVDGVLYAYTPSQKVVALDAATGNKIWVFYAGTPGYQPSRGLSYWTDGKTKILFAGALTNLYALDPATGKPISGFGDGGKIDLRKGLTEGDYSNEFAALTTPGIVFKDMIIVGFRAPETSPALRGDIRAFDVHSGALRWTFHTIPHPGEYGYETWPKDAWKTAGAANNWAGMVLDEKREILYAPTGSAVTDFYGSDRIGDDLFADTLLALDANTGKRIWHFQAVHHDIWDRDFSSPPALVTVHQNGRSIDAIAQTTKQGFLFLFDRENGKPVFAIEQRKFPASDVPDEQASSTQPVPSLPAPYARQLLTGDMLTTRTPEAHQWAIEQFKQIRSEGQFVPFSIDKQTIVFPGFDGGAEWGGPAVDPRSGVIYINSNDVAWTGGLTENKKGDAGSTLYQTQCASCHGVDRKGSPPTFPSLIGVDKRLSTAAITQVIHDGKGRMSAFPGVADTRLAALLGFLKIQQDSAESVQEFTLKKKVGEDTQATSSPPVAGNRNEIAGAKLYDKNCGICHGEDLLGAPSNYPALVGVRGRLSDAQILDNIHNGKGRMPSFKKLSDLDTQAILRFLGDSFVSIADASSKREAESLASPAAAARYHFTGYRKFLDLEGYPAIIPPWGTLNAIDLNTGKYLWKIPLGEYPELTAKGMTSTGSENYGGPIVTAGGIVIIGATIFDRKIRAFDSHTGDLLWEAELPYAGVATPATYMVDKKQYIVIATSGARDTKGPQGAAYVAFALPDAF